MSTRRVRYALAMICVVTGSCVVAGCSAPAARTGHRAEAAPPMTDEARALVLPFDAYEASLADYYTLRDAQDALTRTCMRERGFDWPVIDRPTAVDENRNRRRYGVIEPAVAERFGYHATPDLLDPYGVSGREDRRDARLSDEEDRAANAPDTGCVITAHRKLLDDARADVDLKLFNDLGERALAAARDEPDTARALREWSACMRGAGFDYPGPYEAMKDDRWWKDDTLPTRQEIAVAVADVRCKQRSGLVEAWFAAEKRLQERAIRDHPAYFTALKDAKQRHIATARAVLD
ncbi:hypothetical protein [Streptomyces sp. URMC 123]|uniref:hypothetical protein n=1 Tax=Streptomyces sp. URMC 123 TaxID=3423403 RepID=UPI003F1A0479